MFSAQQGGGHMEEKTMKPMHKPSTRIEIGSFWKGEFIFQ